MMFVRLDEESDCEFTGMMPVDAVSKVKALEIFWRHHMGEKVRVVSVS